ncbi:MAG: putative DNA modification/repair radical SAM protein [Firmicutes bacterium]|jgi:putative DNA modification/repair radical SAM protein|nr:putative DNA modification/repair radical SAM protein [Bacillota bacterium]NBI61630.1 putative DNA modification/repair radical SAM protein [Clostridiales bacterium]
MDGMLEKLKILADSAKYDVSCSSSGVGRKNNGKIGSGAAEGICHTWSADGRCISLLKVLFTNRCVYDCEYCVNRRSADTERASFEPEELAKLTIEFYRRNYIEGLFLSSAVEVSPDHTAERILHCLRLLRREYGFAGYIHAKIIPGVSQELLYAIGLEADRLSVNIEMPTSKSLALFAPQKKPKQIFSPMRQITNTLIERKALKGPGTMFKGQDLNSTLNYLTPGQIQLAVSSEQIKENQNMDTGPARAMVPARRGKETFAPAGQTTQMIIGAGGETDRQILTTTENLYHTFKMKRVYYSAYIPVVSSPILPDALTAPPLGREHRLYQADWLLRFYGFQANEILDDENPNLDPDLDPKVTWALRHLDQFPVEVNKAPMDHLLRIPGVGAISAQRITRQRKIAAVKYEDLKKMGVVLKRARHFLTCSGKYYGEKNFMPEAIKHQILEINDGIQISMFNNDQNLLPRAGTEGKRVALHG